MEKMKFETVDGTRRNVDKIAEMFPQVVTEVLGEDGKLKRAVKWDVLKELLSGDYVEGGECYEFTWPGKRAAIAEAAKPIRKTLRPCKEESKNWDTTENLYIEGDNLEVLKLLQESYLGKVKMIYIDPPYNTGNDFVYKDNFTKTKDTSEDELGLFDDETDNRTMSGELFHNTESNGRFHSDWCSMIYPRLQIAKDLLSDDGVIFISIDDNEQENLKKICDEILGTQNFVAQIIRVSSPSQNIAKFVSVMHDYTLIYCKNKNANCGDWKVKKNYADEFERRAHQLLSQGVSEDNIATELRALTKYPRFFDFDHYTMCDSHGVFQLVSMGGVEKGNTKTVIFHPQTGNACNMPQGGWRYKEDVLLDLVRKGHIYYGKDENSIPRRKYYLQDYLMQIPKGVNFYDTQSDVRFLKENRIPFDFPKPKDYIAYFAGMIRLTSNDIVLDFFSGSATAAHAVMQLNAEDGGNRKFIMVQLPEVCADDSEAAKAGYKNICEIGKERIRRAGEKIKEEAGLAAANLDIGFRVFKVADSNMKDVYYSASDYSQDMLDSLVSNIKEDRTDLDLLYGCLLEWGVELSLPHTSETIDNVTVHTVNNGDLIACFDADIPESTIRTIAKRQPLRAVFRDSSFSSAPQKINVEEIFKLLSPTTTVKVI